MSLKLMGKKKGMTRLFDEKGNVVVCTVISAEPNVIVQMKTEKKDGYAAVQLGAIKVAESKKRNVKKPLVGHFAAAKLEPRKHLLESKTEKMEDLEVGKEISFDYFSDCKYVDVCGVSKGKGFQGVIKRHNFAGGPGSHGSGFARSGGSTGMRSTPGRCLPQVKKPGQMGSERVTTHNLKIVRIDLEKNVILVQGAIPGAKNGLVYVRKAIKKHQNIKGS